MNSAWDVKSLYFRMDGEEKQIASDGASYPSPPVSDAEAIERTRKRITEDGFISYITSAGKTARFDLLGMGIPEIYTKANNGTKERKRLPRPGEGKPKEPRPTKHVRVSVEWADYIEEQARRRKESAGQFVEHVLSLYRDTPQIL